MESADRVGLCFTCLHSRQVKSGKGSMFWLCERSKTDARFPKYPALPVVRCIGYESENQDGRTVSRSDGRES